MISDVNKYVQYLLDHKITEEQFLYLWLIHTKNKEMIALYKKARGFNITSLDDLIERGYINDFGLIKDNYRTFDIYDFIVTDKFTKIVIVDEEDAYEELKKVYPKWFNIDGKRIPAAGGDPIKIAKDYYRLGHKGNRIEHQRIVEITENYHKKHKDPMVKLENYILNKMWTLIEEESKGPSDSFTIL